RPVPWAAARSVRKARPARTIRPAGTARSVRKARTIRPACPALTAGTTRPARAGRVVRTGLAWPSLGRTGRPRLRPRGRPGRGPARVAAMGGGGLLAPHLIGTGARPRLLDEPPGAAASVAAGQPAGQPEVNPALPAAGPGTAAVPRPTAAAVSYAQQILVLVN